MKKSIKIILPIVLALLLVVGTGWYLLSYDTAFTRDVLLFCARGFEDGGNHTVATWLYNRAYSRAGGSDEIAIELAQQYARSGNYTKAERTLTSAIADGGSLELYAALSKIYVEQDKLLDAVTFLDSVTNADVSAALASRRPAVPTPGTAPGFYNQYISVSFDVAPGATAYIRNNGTYPSVHDAPYTEPVVLADGENNVYAIAISGDGLVSPLGIYGYTVGGVIKQVEFADSEMERAIRAAAGIPADKTVMTNELWALKEFTVPAGAKTMEDLKYLGFAEKLTVNGCAGGMLKSLSALTNLKELKISNTPITPEEMPVIGALPALETLVMNHCSVTTTAGLERAEKITSLDLSNNAIVNISGLVAMTGVKKVNLSHNAISDIAELKGLVGVTELDLSYNVITSAAPLAAMKGLSTLRLSNNKLQNAGGLEALASLQELDLGYNALTSVGALASCKALVSLNLSNNTLSDITALASLTKLEKLSFAHNKVSAIPSFGKSCALVSIDGSYNSISSLSPLSGLGNLNTVNMDYNPNISTVDCLADCPVLITVNVYGTKVKKATKLTDQSIVVNYKVG